MLPLDVGNAMLDGDIGLGLALALWLAVLSRAYATSGRAVEAREALAQALQASDDRFVSPVALAIAYAGLEELDAARDALRSADAQKDPMRIYVTTHPQLEALR